MASNTTKGAGINQAGEEITAAEADAYLKKYMAVRGNLLREQAIPITPPPTTITEEERVEVNRFYESDVNAFIFSKDLIERFFKTEDPSGNPMEPAEYLMVITSAKYVGTSGDIGKPTVVTAGVSLKPDGTYRSMHLPNAANQQPPTARLVEFPSETITPYQINVII